MSVPGNLEDQFLILAQCVDGMGGPFSDMLRRSAAVRLVKLEPGVSPEHVFPIPTLRRLPGLKLLVSGIDVGSFAAAQVCLANLRLSILNFLYFDSAWGFVASHEPSEAQRRLQRFALKAAGVFFDDGLPWPDEAEIKSQLRHRFLYSGSGEMTRLLGLRCGIPAAATQVDLAGALDEFHPVLARQVCQPTALLLPRRARPSHLKRPYAHVDSSYPQLVQLTVASRLQVLAPKRSVWKHKRKPLINGGFAVPKDDNEDRFISS
jgi:hypothetical protein